MNLAKIYFFNLINNILYLFYPEDCPSCNGALFKHEKIVCLKCEHSLPYANINPNSSYNPLKNLFGRIPLEGLYVYLFFNKGSRVQQMMHSLKYKQNEEIGSWLGKSFAEYLLNNNIPMEQIDCVVPVPLHPKKLKKRGYNQAEVIARGFANATGKSVMSNLILKKVFTESQTKMGKVERWLNIKDSFEIAVIPNLNHQHILLIDDVITTGATLEAVSSSLLINYPNLKISIAAIAYA